MSDLAGMARAEAQMEVLAEIAQDMEKATIAGNANLEVLKEDLRNGKVSPAAVFEQTLESYAKIIEAAHGACERIRLRVDEDFKRAL